MFCQIFREFGSDLRSRCFRKVLTPNGERPGSRDQSRPFRRLVRAQNSDLFGSRARERNLSLVMILRLPAASEKIKALEKLRRNLGAFQDLEMLKCAVNERNGGPDPDRILSLVRKRQN
jgi:hypothetical protein